MLSVVAEQAAAQLDADAAAILLHNPRTHMLEFAAGHGFRTRVVEQSRVRLGDGVAGEAALSRRTRSAPDLAADSSGFARALQASGEAFVSHYAAPLIAKGKIKGVLEVFYREHAALDAEWLEFLETLAVQAAIAIDNASLFADLQRSNADLALAYDATIEGWATALELRDRDTRGHTLRVTEQTLDLAQAVGMRDEQIVHLRRGALLHDIGKLGVPDAILHKPTPLTDDEWRVMRRHPQLAYDMLTPIVYLRPALDIPYCHHEKWDGTGYPRGLAGDNIPLAARVFAVADVWDALTNDRPYRAAWPAAQALEYIEAQAGSHFDPQVTAVFLNAARRRNL
jgi:HD-GYP domain-containing protein (c-di-GMP phosphodiesterase class II)